MNSPRLTGGSVSKTSVIAITGPSASGKSLFASTVYQELVAELGGEHIAILAEDAYYRDQNHLSLEQRVLTNYDHPAAFEHELLARHLQMLRQGQRIAMPQYNFKTHTRHTETISVHPASVILVEGILLLTVAKLRHEFDISVYMDTPLDICLLRRIKRDTVERGRTPDAVMAQYETTVRPAYFEFIAPSRQHADLVVTGGGRNQIAIDILKTKIRQLTAK